MIQKKHYIIILIFIILFTIISLGLYYCIYNILPYSTIRPFRVNEDTRERLINTYLTSELDRNNINKFDVLVEDSINLKCLFVKANSDTIRGTIVMLHGIGNCKESLIGFAIKLSYLGYNCILFDFRASGESGGINCTYGYYEKYDVSKVIDYTLQNFNNIEPIAIYGHSLGAAIAIQSMSMDKRIKCGIVESPFATLREVIYDYWVRLSGIPINTIPYKALEVSERIANFKVDSVRPEESAKYIDCPVLVIHGKKDTKISYRYGKRVYNNLHSLDKKLYPIENGYHDNLSEVGGEGYMNTIIGFLYTHLKKN